MPSVGFEFPGLWGSMPVAHQEARTFPEQSPLHCRGSTLLLELKVDGPQHHPEKQVDGKRGKEPPKIEAERCTLAHDVRKQQGKDEPPGKAKCKPPEKCAADRNTLLPLERTKDEAKHPSQRDQQAKAGEFTAGRVCNRDPKPV